MTYTPGTLHGRHAQFKTDVDDVPLPAEGYATITPHPLVVRDELGGVILSGAWDVPLEVDGSWTVKVPPRNGAGVDPQEVSYTVDMHLGHANLPPITGVQVNDGGSVDVNDWVSVLAPEPESNAAHEADLSRIAAEGFAEDSAESATASAQSAFNAGQSATQAGQSAAEGVISKNAAAQSAAEGVISKNAAAQSAAEAVISKNAAAQSVIDAAAALGSAIAKALIDAKGDLIVGTADNTPTRMAVGGNGAQLVADSAQATGLRWSTAGVFEGTGSPEGVISAVIGSTYVDTAATNGAWLWRKRTAPTGSTGWVCVEGDTDWRDVGSLHINGWTNITGSFLRRCGMVVELRAAGNNASTTNPIFNLPVGFRPARTIQNSVQSGLLSVTTTGDVSPVTATTALRGGITYTTRDPWPAGLLPGAGA